MSSTRPTHEVLHSIQEAVGEEICPAIIRRLLRVPPVWHGLHEPGTLETALPHGPDLTPAAVVRAADEATGVQMVRHEQLITGEAQPESISDMAVLRAYLLDEVQDDESEAGVAERVELLGSAGAWALACAWPDLPQAEQLLVPFMRSDSLSLIDALTTALLANNDPEAVAEELLSTRADWLDLMAALDPDEEPELTRSIASKVIGEDLEPVQLGAIDRLFAEGISQQALDRPEAAESTLEQAWQFTTQRGALIADRMADIAEERGDWTLAIQARERALDQDPTPVRRAALGLATLWAGDPMKATQLVTAPYKSDEERIAAATVHASLGQHESAREALEAVETSSLDGEWQRQLSVVWRDLGESKLAIRAMQAAVHSRPVLPELRAQLAELLLKAGDSQAAAGEAALAAYLSPSHLPARRTLAHSLEKSGEHKRALEEWLEIVEHDPAAKPAVVESALRAEDPSTALSFAQQLLTADADSAIARTAMGKALVAAGNPKTGREHLRRATNIAPDDAQAWIALAQAESQLGDRDSAGKTLQSAVQSCPSDARLRAELADWLAESERWTEAAEHARRALDLEPENPDCVLRGARLEKQLGHIDKARSLYEKAYQLRPADLQTRTALARIHESSGEYERALDVLGSLPEAASGSDRALLGRLLIGASGVEDDPGRGEEALTALQQAEENGCDREDLAYWKGRAFALMGDHQRAMRAYQACLRSLPGTAHELRESCLCAQAKAALADGQAPVAISVLETAIESGLSTAAILANLSSAYLAASLPDEALRSAAKAVELDPDHREARENLVEAARAAKAWEMLIEKTEQWYQEQHEADPFAFDRALALHRLDRAQDARDTLAEAIWPRRKDIGTLRRAAEVLREIDQPADAQRLLVTAKASQPEDSSITADLAQAAQQAGDFETAYEAWSELIDREPDNEEALIGAAQALWSLDRRAASIGLLQRVVKQRPDDGVLHAKLARAQLDNGEVTQALDHYRTAVELNPEATETAWDAAQALLKYDAPEQALQVLDSLLSRDPQRQDALLAAGEAHLRLGQAKEALATIGRLQADATVPAAEALRCHAYRALGDESAAEQALEAALSARPKSALDLRWQLRTALEFGRWQAAEELLTASQLEGPEALKLAVWARVRLADAHWLFAVRGEVQNHAPSPDQVSEETEQELLQSMERAPGLSEHQRQRLAGALKLATGDLTTSDIESPPAAAGDSPWARTTARDSWVAALLREEKADRALQVLSDSPPSSVVSEWGPLLAGLAHIDLERYSMARKAFGALESTSQLRPVAAYFTALSWLSEGRRDEAINALNNAVLAWPEEAAWQHRLAGVYLQAGMPETALPHLQQALDLRPKDIELQTDYARALKSNGQLSEAESVYSQILPKREGDIEIWHAAAETALTLGAPEVAEQRYSHALELDPDNAAARIGAAKSALANGDERASRDHIERVLEQPPAEADALIQLGQLLMDHDRHDKALEVFDQALRSAERPLSVHRARSQLLLKMGRAQEAIQALQRVVEADPGDDQAWSALAEGYKLTGQPDHAVDALRLAIEARPGSISYRLRLARMHREAGQLDQALALLTELEQEAPQSAGVAFELGRVHQDRRQHPKALHQFERAIQLNDQSAAAHFHAGMVLKALKAYGKAASMFRKAADLNPNDSDALHQLAAVQALDLVHGGRQQQVSAVTP